MQALLAYLVRRKVFASFHALVQLTDSIAVGVAVVAMAAAGATFRFAFDLFDFAFIHSSTAPKRANNSSIFTGSGSLCGVTSKG